MKSRKILLRFTFIILLVLGLGSLGSWGCGGFSPPAGIPSPVSNLMSVSNPDAGGNVMVTGSSGAVLPGAVVIGNTLGNTSWWQRLLVGVAWASNGDTGATTIAGPDGSFQFRVSANIGNIIRIFQMVGTSQSTPTDLTVADDTVALEVVPKGLAINSVTHTAFVTGGNDSEGLIFALNLGSTTPLLSFPGANFTFPDFGGIGAIAVDAVSNFGVAVSNSDNQVVFFNLDSEGGGIFQSLSSPLSVAAMPGADRTVVSQGNTSNSLSFFTTSTGSPCISVLIPHPSGASEHLATPLVKILGAPTVPQVLAVSQYQDNSWVISQLDFTGCAAPPTIKNQVILPNNVEPSGLVGFNGGNQAIVVDSKNNQVLFVNFTVVPGTIVATIPVGKLPGGGEVLFKNNKAYIVNSMDNSVTSINLASLAVQTVGAVGLFPTFLAIDEGLSLGVVLSQVDQTAVIIELDF